jgi:6-phosphogluconolactonase
MMANTVSCKNYIMNDNTIIIFDSTDEIADAIVDLLKNSISRNADRNITVALSGGSTPAKVFRYITEHHQNTIDWSKVLFFWGDERCVPPSDGESNYNMTRINLFEPMGISEKNIFRVMGEMTPEDAVEHYKTVLNDHVIHKNNLPAFDVVILGMGDDGHTASLFPGDQSALSSTASCVLATHPASGQKRVSLTLSVINNAFQAVFLVTGASKAEMVSRVKKPDTGLPAAMVKPTNGDLLWLLDKDAATLL